MATAQEFELDKVTKEELAEKKHPADPTAAAAILHKSGITFFDFNNTGHWIIVTDVKVKVKIYTKEGYEHANISVPYFAATSGDEDVQFLDAYTYNLNNDKIEKTKLKPEGIFTEAINNVWKSKKITMPNVKEGSIIEYNYVIRSPYITNFPDWYFQDQIPVNKVNYSVHIPQYFVYNRILSPYFPVTEKKETKEQRRNFSDSRPKGGYNSGSGLSTTFGTASFLEVRQTYTAQNLPALKDEQYVDNINNYLSYVKHELSVTKMPDAAPKQYATDWNAVAKSIYNDESFGKELEESGYFEKDIAVAAKGAEDHAQIINMVFNFVKSSMTWNENYGFLCRKGVKAAYKDKTGNAAEINLMLIAMLRHFGLKANPVLVSTRSHGHVEFVNRNQFNFVIAAVESQGKIILLDATGKNAMPDVLPIRNLNRTGRLMRRDFTTLEVDLVPVVSAKENVAVFADILADGTVTGKVKSGYTGHNAYIAKENNSAKNREEYIESLEKRMNAEINDFLLTADEDYTKPVSEYFTFKSGNACEVIGDRIYFSPMLMYTQAINPFKDDVRTYPVDFVFPQQDRYTFTITIPEGYVIESMPAAQSIAMKDNICTFVLNIAGTNGKQVQVVAIRHIGLPTIYPEYYPDLKLFYQKMIEQQNQKIVLKKA